MDTIRGEGVERGGEIEKKPRYRLMITRHAERLPSGELSPEGIAHAKRKGQAVKGVEVLKGYASDHKSGRAFDTTKSITEESGVVFSATGKPYETRKVPDIQYAVLEPDLAYVIPAAKSRIEEATLRELGMSTERDEEGKLKINIEKLSKEEQVRIAPVRQKYQKLGFEYVLNEVPEAVHRMAIGIAHQLVEKMEVMSRYDRARKTANKPPKGDVVINEGTHGMFMESLLKEAGVIRNADGTEGGIDRFDTNEFGGYIQPVESMYLEIDDPAHIPDRISVTFESDNRPQGRVFIDRKKLEALEKDYQAWKLLLEKKH